MKDHRHPDVLFIARKSYEHSVRRGAENQGYHVEKVAIQSGSSNEKPVHFHITKNVNPSVRRQIYEGVRKVQFLNINWAMTWDEQEQQGKNTIVIVFCT